MRLRNSLVIAVSLILLSVDGGTKYQSTGCCGVALAQTMPQAPVIGGGSFLNCVERRNYVTPEERISICLWLLQQGPESLPGMMRFMYQQSTILGAIGEAYYDMGDYVAAMENYQAAIFAVSGDGPDQEFEIYEANRGFARAAHAMALVDLQEGNIGRARHYAEMAGDMGEHFRRRHKDDTVAFSETLGTIYVIEGMEDEAFEAFSRAIELGGSRIVQKYQEELWGYGFYDGDFDGTDGGAFRSALRDCIAAQCPLNQ